MGWNKTSWADVIGQDSAKQTVLAGNSITGEVIVKRSTREVVLNADLH